MTLHTPLLLQSAIQSSFCWYRIITSRFCGSATCVLIDSGIQLSCVVRRKFYDGTMDWLLLPIRLPNSVQTWFTWFYSCKVLLFGVSLEILKACIMWLDPVACFGGLKSNPRINSFKIHGGVSTLGIKLLLCPGADRDCFGAIMKRLFRVSKAVEMYTLLATM